jgi:hypothetical protein
MVKALALGKKGAAPALRAFALFLRTARFEPKPPQR